jgi:hypothetical protein
MPIRGSQTISAPIPISGAVSVLLNICSAVCLVRTARNETEPIAYWAARRIIALTEFAGGILDLTHIPMVDNLATSISYPLRLIRLNEERREKIATTAMKRGTSWLRPPRQPRDRSTHS